GCDAGNFYLRMDFLPGCLDQLTKSASELHVRLGGGGAQPVELVAHLTQGARNHGAVDVCVGRIFEMRASLASLGLRSAVYLQFQDILVEDGHTIDDASTEDYMKIAMSD